MFCFVDTTLKSSMMSTVMSSEMSSVAGPLNISVSLFVMRIHAVNEEAMVRKNTNNGK